MTLNSITKWSFALTVAASLAACSTGQRAETAQTATEGAASVAQMTGPTEAEMIHIVTTVNTAEIEAAHLARSKSKNQNIVKFANMMIKDHTKNTKEAARLAKKMNLKADGNEISKSLKAGSMATMASLKNLSGNEFNQAYIDQQLKMHQTTLDTINNSLLPKATSEEMKAYLNKTQASVTSHLEHAQRLQSQTNMK